MKNKALILIGFQNDYFAPDGILKSVVEESSKDSNIVENTVSLIEKLEDTLIISTPIIFSSNYSELKDPIGILKTIKDVGAFKEGSKGSETIEEIKNLDKKIITIPGKLGLNAFMNTNLNEVLIENNIDEVILAGTVASICIDSTGRSAFEKGYKVHMLSDCISSRSIFEKDFYFENVFPLYAKISTSSEFLN